MEEKNNVVKNDSKAYGYSYASLGDIAKQGYPLPKMKTGTEDGRDFIYYKDVDEWIRGAEIVAFEQKGMNKAQIYGAALTYARRYTTLMANCLACDDDKKVETQKEDPKPTPKKENPNPTPKYPQKPKEEPREAKSLTDDELLDSLRKLYKEDEIKYLESVKKVPLKDFGRETLEAYYDHRKNYINLAEPEKPFY